MPAGTPEELDQLFIEKMNAGDLEAVVSLYEPDATLAPQPGQTVTGTAAIRDAVRGFIAMQPRFTATPKPTVRAGDVALTGLQWTLDATGPDGSRVQMKGHSAEVVRRQPDGTWKFVVDNPFVAD
jgi:uncharacterized protein (TIGR02246 family)